MGNDGHKVVALKKRAENLGTRILRQHWGSHNKLGSARTWLISLVVALTFLAFNHLLSRGV
jgi:hypothetical protein